MSPGRLWQKLRTLWGSDERLDALEAAARTAAERMAAGEASLAEARLELERRGARGAAALESAAAELRGELAVISAGLRALEARVSSLSDEHQRSVAAQAVREVEHQARRAEQYARQGELEARQTEHQARQADHETRQAEREASLKKLDERFANVEPTVASVVASAAALQAGLERIRSALESLAGEVRAPEPWREFRSGLEQMQHVVAHQGDQLDLLKSSLEVDRTLTDEFQAWKSTHVLSRRPLVSVCVPTYNRAQLLVERCLPSVLAQSYDHLEVVVVGDGCTDDTAERVAAVRDRRVRFVNLPHRGDYPADPLRRWMVAGTSAVNKALARARGELITHLDDDDEYLPERLAKLVSFMLEQGCDLVWHPFWYEDREGQWLLNDAAQFAFSRVTTSSVLYRSWFKKIPWDPEAHRLLEPGDWNRFRRLRYLGSDCRRFPEPLLRHYRERRPGPEPAGSAS
jgi:hypothetical protein